jgi:hypothetical protein
MSSKLVDNLPTTSTTNGSRAKEVKLKFRFVGSSYHLVISINENDPDLATLVKLITPLWIDEKVCQNPDLLFLDTEGKGMEIVIGTEADHKSIGFLNDKDYNKELSVEVHGEDALEAIQVGAQRIETKLQTFSSL